MPRHRTTTATRDDLVTKYLCPGCVAGSDTECGKYEPQDGGCSAHVLGTSIFPAPGNIALGMPKGFNRPGWCQLEKRTHNQMPIRVWPKGEAPTWDWLNVPVWALEHEGDLFVRTVCPRTAALFVDVIEGGKAAELCPQAINVTERYDEYD